MKGQRCLAILRLLIVACVLTAALAAGVASAGADEEVLFTILHTNDEHSALIPHSSAVDYDPDGPDPTVGGFGRLATLIDDLRSEAGDEPVLLFSAGDFIGGSPFSWLALEARATELALMLAMGYDAVILGNHEFDYGPDVLAQYLGAAGYPAAAADTVILSGNAQIPPDHPLAGVGLVPTHLFALPGSGVRVGVFGLLGDHALSVAADVDPVQFSEPRDFAQSAVAELRDSGADLIIAITHAGVEEDRQLAREVAGIDVIVGGHCHTALAEPVIEDGTIIVQAGCTGRYLGCLQLAYSPATRSLRLRNAETGHPYLLEVDDTTRPDPAVASQVAAATSELNDLIARVTDGKYDDIYRVIARSEFTVSRDPPLAESPYGNLVSDAFRWSVQRVTGERVDFAFQANGQIRGSLHPGITTRAEGDLSFYDIASTVGLGSGPGDTPGYPLISTYLTGDEVRRVLEIGPLLSAIMGDAFFLQSSGLRFTYDPGRSILLWLPVVDKPLPTYRAVLSAERYVGDDPSMEEGEYVPLEWKDDQLYHVVADLYVASFIPMVGDILPRLQIQPKDSDGNPVAEATELIVYHRDRPLTAWEAVTDYLAAMPSGADGRPEICRYYAAAAGRGQQVATLPLILWPVLGLLILGLLTCYLIARRRARRMGRTDEGGGAGAVQPGG